MTEDPAGSDRYSYRLVLSLWFLATLPMILLAWVVAPWLILHTGLPAAPTYFLLSALGMIWQGALAWIGLRLEGPGLRREDLRRRLWLAAPSHPGTSRRRLRALFWIVPLMAVATTSLLLANAAASATMVFRFLREPSWSRFFPAYAKSFGLMSPELAGQWWWLVVVPVVALAAVLGEEFLFRGLLLPRMTSRRGNGGWLANVSLYSLYHVYQPWMIPARVIATIGAAWAAERYRSNWIPVAVRLDEVAGLTLATLIGVSSFRFPPLPASMDPPHVERRPPAAGASARPLYALPACDLTRGSFSVDVRSRDLSTLDLRSRAKDVDCAAFDDRTVWPAVARLPPGFDPARILEANRNPGLGLRALHARGVTGRGIGIAIIDFPLLVEHREYAARLRWYEEVDTAYPFRPPRPGAHMHGTAVASIALGQTVGVAPEADLFFVATPFESFKEVFLRTHIVAQAMRRIVEINRALPRDLKIRAISLSHGWGDAAIGYSDAEAAVVLARSEGIAFFSGNHAASYGGLARPALGDPDSFEDYAPSWMWRTRWMGRHAATNLFYVPIDTRTLASETGDDSYAHYALGGNSGGPPFMAGLFALAAQVDPAITPERFMRLAARHTREGARTAAPDGVALRILDPGALIAALAPRARRDEPFH